eukprot:TRINITY_DN620_c0_g1_i2.p3 TRINITY_DN620_c0_g1~~TRINITY_DN620_c0_g1_i2.p3  ORF type:complete len:114 (+),score=18.84 TRINITY_DN620_c0_g1_i2:39-380(+)
MHARREVHGRWRRPAASELLPAAAANPGVLQLLLSCSGHPRSLFEGRRPAAGECDHISTARQIILSESRFPDIKDWEGKEVVMNWFDKLGTRSKPEVQGLVSRRRAADGPDGQ